MLSYANARPGLVFLPLTQRATGVGEAAAEEVEKRRKLFVLVRCAVSLAGVGTGEGAFAAPPRLGEHTEEVLRAWGVLAAPPITLSQHSRL